MAKQVTKKPAVLVKEIDETANMTDERLRRKIDQEQQLAGLALIDGDIEAADKHYAQAKKYKFALMDRQ